MGDKDVIEIVIRFGEPFVCTLRHGLQIAEQCG